MSERSSDELARLKLELEIRQLRRWWTPNALAATATIVATVLAFASAVWIGYFDKSRLDFERTKLSASIEGLKIEKQQLEQKLHSLEQDKSTLEAGIRDIKADGAALERELRRAVSQSSASVQTLFESNSVLRRQVEERDARAEKYQQEIAGLHKTLSESSQQKRESDIASQALRKQLEQFPPLARDASLAASHKDLSLSGEVIGANLGLGPGIVEIRVIKREKRGPGEEARVLVPPTTLSRQSIKQWTETSIRFAFGTAERNRFIESITAKVPRTKDLDLLHLLFFDEIDFEARVTTADEARTAWTFMSKGELLEFSTEPIPVADTVPPTPSIRPISK